MTRSSAWAASGAACRHEASRQDPPCRDGALTCRFFSRSLVYECLCTSKCHSDLELRWFRSSVCVCLQVSPPVSPDSGSPIDHKALVVALSITCTVLLVVTSMLAYDRVRRKTHSQLLNSET